MCHPFANLNAADIANRVNYALDNLNVENLPFSIIVKAVKDFYSESIRSQMTP